VILITHDLGVVAGMTRRINVMYAGYVVESATTVDLFAEPSHPYTVGLLHSMPRLDAEPGEPLLPIEGTPPDLRFAPVGCPFAPRCAWRMDLCWKEMPGLEPINETDEIQTTGPSATHRSACWNRPTPQEAVAGRPLRDGFVPAPPIETER
jgi:oligopeptide transport system ATP-binding protein